MTEMRNVEFASVALDALNTAEGRIACLVPAEGTMGPGARRMNRLTKGAVARALDSDAWEKVKTGEALSLSWPVGIAAEGVDLVKLPRRVLISDARKAGASLARLAGTSAVTVVTDGTRRPEELALGLALRSYSFTARKSTPEDTPARALIMVRDMDLSIAAFQPLWSAAQGIFFTRDLVSEPANVLNTVEFADRLLALRALGLEVDVLDEAQLTDLGMNALLSVGMGSICPSKVVVMRWRGADTAPLALIGKGVVFDTGGISLKPAGGMEDMTMDMGGAGTVAGVMKTLALRGAKAHVVGLVGLVENMPSDRAMRPGDIVTSMKGDTIEVINTDAEGRLVLCDVMWHAQQSEKPVAMIDLATLTGACIVALGHENAGVFSNDDSFAGDFLKAAQIEGEGAWRLPLGSAYDTLIKSQKADMKNVGGRWGGAITAAQFLQRFVKDGVPWIHLDIAGVAQVPTEATLAGKGATGWGVLALDRLVRDKFETRAEVQVAPVDDSGLQ